MGAIVLPLLLALLLLYVLVYFARMAGQALARSREVTRFQFEAKALLAQVDPILEGLATRTDSARRQIIPPDEILADLESGTTTLEAARVTADQIKAPQHGRVLRDAMGEDVDRAIRAVAMIQHGCERARRRLRPRRRAGGADGREARLPQPAPCTGEPHHPRRRGGAHGAGDPPARTPPSPYVVVALGAHH